MNTNQPNVVPAVITAGTEVLHVMGTELHFGATCDHTGNGCFQWLNIAGPGLGVPMHVHDNEDELFLVLEGAVRVEIAGQPPILATPGTSIFGPRGVAHAWFTHGDRPCRMLVTALPGGMERMFRELSKLPPPPATDFTQVAEICGRYGIRFA